MITGNGYIEGTELDGFLREFVSSVNLVDVGPEVNVQTDLNNYTKPRLYLKTVEYSCMYSGNSIYSIDNSLE